MRHIKTRSRTRTLHQPYPLNEIPQSTIVDICARLVHFIAVGNADWKDGDIFSRMFADSINGQVLNSPLGIADVVYESCAWSVKTVKNTRPHEATKVRLISGRNSPKYSAGITDSTKDIQATGRAVLDIYNQRIEQARSQYDTIRMLILLRNMADLSFTIYERPIEPYATNNYTWKLNKRKNHEAYRDDVHIFTWQPHGSQFTIIESIPPGATKFEIDRQVSPLLMEHVLQLVRFKPEWVKIL